MLKKEMLDVMMLIKIVLYHNVIHPLWALGWGWQTSPKPPPHLLKVSCFSTNKSSILYYSKHSNLYKVSKKYWDGKF